MIRRYPTQTTNPNVPKSAYLLAEVDHERYVLTYYWDRIQEYFLKVTSFADSVRQFAPREEVCRYTGDDITTITARIHYNPPPNTVIRPYPDHTYNPNVPEGAYLIVETLPHAQPENTTTYYATPEGIYKVHRADGFVQPVTMRELRSLLGPQTRRFSCWLAQFKLPLDKP